MKFTLVLILFLVFTSFLTAETYDGKIVFKADVVLNANDIEVVDDNLVYKIGLNSKMDTVKLSEVDYLLAYDKSYVLEGVVLGLGVGSFVYLVAGEKEDLLSYMVVSTLVFTLAGAALVDYKKIDIAGGLSTSFLNGANFLPQTNVVNYQLVSLSLQL